VLGSECVHELFEKTFRYDLCVNFEDCDMGGVVFHPNYLKYLERARSEMLRELGYSFREMLNSGYAFVVSEHYSKYVTPALFDDRLTVHSVITGLSPTSIRVKQRITKLIGGEEALVHAIQIRLVCVNLNSKRPEVMPPVIRKLLNVDIENLPKEFAQVRVSTEF